MRAAALAAAAVLLVAGCGGDSESGGGSGKQSTMIDWDLSKSHTMQDVDWPKPDLDSVDVQPEGEVRVRLPGGKEFSAEDGVIRHAFVTRKGNTVVEAQLNTSPRSRKEAYELATDWAGRYGFTRAPLEDWYEKSADVQPAEASKALTRAPTGETIGPGGPEGAVKILASSNQEKPWVVAFLMVWRAGDGT
jgi:hypothetical protein